jgi:hypothetical protein
MAVNEDDPFDDDIASLEQDAPEKPLRVSRISERLGPDAPYGKSSDKDALHADLERLDANIPQNPGRWDRAADQTHFISRIIAIAFLGCFLVGWPLGTTLATLETTGLLKFRMGFTLPVFMYMITIPLLIFIFGRMAAIALRMAGKAEQLEASAARLAQPETHAVEGVRTVGNAVSAQMDTLNAHLDDALTKLAGVESMIRQQVKAIDSAAAAMEDGSVDSVRSVAEEREKLIGLTETLNTQADAFAEAIAEKAKLAAERSDAAHARIAGAEAELDNRLTKLEETAGRALLAFETLTQVLVEKENTVSASSATLSNATSEAASKSLEASRLLEENTQAITAAQHHLAQESQRLEELIQDQKERAERLATTISYQTEKLGQLSIEPTSPATPASPVQPQAETPARTSAPHDAPLNLGAVPQGNDQSTRDVRQNRSWRDILAAADQPGEPLTLNRSPGSPAENAQGNNVINHVRSMQEFMYVLTHQLYGAPEPAALVRFEGGERNIFANLLLAEDADNLKQRIRLEAARDDQFQKGIYDFLENFDKLLEPATDEHNSETLIDDYLGSPLGRMYLLIGSAVDYFS